MNFTPQLQDSFTQLNALNPEEVLNQLEELASYKVRETWSEMPIKFLETYNENVRFPKVIREIFAYIYLKHPRRVIIKAPRGGGKSQLMAMIGQCLWYFQNRSVVDMGGSFTQAKEVYDYFEKYVRAAPGMLATLPKDPTLNYTESDTGKYFKCVTASPKQVRGPHPDVLLADEVCETKDELILAALPMVNSSKQPLVMMTSTFHKIFGIFQETWDNAEDLGYARFSWDIFDVAEQFEESMWDDEELNAQIGDLQKLRELANGKTGDPDGFIPIRNILDAWKAKPSLEHFMVEAMGSRPSAKGLVLDPVDVDASMVLDSAVDLLDEKTHEVITPGKYGWFPGAVNVLGIDWGFEGMTAVTGLQRIDNNRKIINYQKNYTQVRANVIIEEIVEQVIRTKVQVIYADSEARFENVELANKLNEEMQKLPHSERFSCRVVEVVFGKEKTEMLGNLRGHFEQRLILIPEKFTVAKWQLKRYHYVEGSDKPAKEHDHIPDSLMCALQHFKIHRARRYTHKDTRNTDDGSGTLTGGLLKTKF